MIPFIVVAITQASSVLVGTVRTSDALPVAGARVSLPALGLEVQSDSNGQFRLRTLSRGIYRLLIAKPGFEPVDLQQRFDVDVLVKDYVLVRSAQLLPGARITAREEPVRNSSLSGFEQRRHSGVGRFLTARDLEGHAGRPTADILAGLPGLMVFRPNSHAACIGISRGSRSFSAQSATCDGTDVTLDCPILVFVDGVKVYSGAPGELLFDVNTIPSRTIAGIELYSSAGSVPAEFSSSRQGCGALIVWTRR